MLWPQCGVCYPWGLVGSLELQVSFAKELYKIDYILQKRHIIFANMCMGWLHVVGSLELQVSFAKEPYKRALLHVFPYGGYNW